MSSSKSTTDKKQRRYKIEQKKAILDRYLKSGMTQVDFCKQEDISTWTLNQWMKKLSVKGKRAAERAPDPDHERDIAQLVALNNVPALPDQSYAADMDERLARVLGATIAEVIRRLRNS